MSQGASPNYLRLAKLARTMKRPPQPKTPSISFFEAEAGKDLFMGKGTCFKCHSLRQTPGNNLRAPSAFEMRLHDDSYLMESIRRPSARIAPAYAHWQAWTVSGLMYSGRLVKQSVDSIELMVESAEGELEFKTIPLSIVEKDEYGKPRIRRS